MDTAYTPRQLAEQVFSFSTEECEEDYVITFYVFLFISAKKENTFSAAQI